MQGVSAVVTTGIYCRPGCAARPRAGNVRRFPLAAAAEAAGYRACLRCRPYRTPPTVSWSGPELVCRGVQMILDGALDQRHESALAARLGVSARQLRRLFTAHLGVTPDGLARSARAHFARRLLDDTDLTVTEIAFAAGFGSLRQFNRVCQEVFRAAPRELRARRRRSDRLVADGGLALRLAYDGPLDWAATVSHLAAVAVPGVEAVTGDVYRRTVVLCGDVGVLEISPGGADHLVLQAHLPHWEELVHLVHRARRVAGLDVDPDPPTRHLANDPVVGPLVQARPGVRVPGTWDPFETAVRAIAGQHVTRDTANATVGRLVRMLGTPVAGLTQLGLTHTFPPPNVLARADLTRFGVAQTMAYAVRGLANAVLDGSVRLDVSVGLDRLVADLEAFVGLGTWAAHYVALRLGEPDACPIPPGGLPLRSLAHHRPDPAAEALVTERWRPWRAWAVMHLGAAADTAEAGQPGAVDSLNT